jgi:hypothetical protein
MLSREISQARIVIEHDKDNIGARNRDHNSNCSSFRDPPSWAQTWNPALCTVLDSGFARQEASAPE